jgi:hypothetical protein
LKKKLIEERGAAGLVRERGRVGPLVKNVVTAVKSVKSMRRRKVMEVIAKKSYLGRLTLVLVFLGLGKLSEDRGSASKSD